MQEKRTRSRPSLLFTPDRVGRLRRRMEGRADLRQRWKQLRACGEELLDRDWIVQSEAEGGSGQHANYHEIGRQMVEAVQTLGLLHQVEPDVRFANKLREGLLHFANFNSWCAPSFAERKPPWRSELITASLAYSYGLAYDMLHDWLSAGDRELISIALVDKAIMPILQDWLLPQTRIHAVDSMGHNWWIVMQSAAGIAALSLIGDHPEAVDWVKQIERAVPLWFGYGGNVLQNKVANFDAGGGYWEGVHYAGYALREYLLYRTALTDALPQALPNFQPADPPELYLAERFLLHTFYPSSRGAMVVNFGDTPIGSVETTLMRLLIEQRFAGKHASWFVSRTEADTTAPHTQALSLLFETDQPITSPVDLPTTAIFPDTSWAIMRSGWEENATLLAVRAGTYWIHAHADSGSFILFHNGEQLIVDAGRCAYHRKEYRDYFVTSQAHNVVLVDGEGVPNNDFLNGTKFPGKVRGVLDDGGLKYVYADATGPMAHKLKRNYRHWIWVDGVIVVFDDLLAHAPATFNWLLHYAGSAQWNAQGVMLRNGAANASVQFLYPHQLNVCEAVGFAEDNADAESKYLDFATIKRAQQQNFLTVIIPGPLDSSKMPRVELIEAIDLLGVRIFEAELTTDVYFNLRADARKDDRNSNAVFDGWDTDAYLLAITRKNGSAIGDRDRDAMRRLLVIDGSYVRREGVSLLDSISKVDCLVIPDTDRVRMNISGQRQIDLNYRSHAEPREVLINGTAHPFAYSPSEQVVRLNITTGR